MYNTCLTVKDLVAALPSISFPACLIFPGFISKDILFIVEYNSIRRRIALAYPYIPRGLCCYS